MGKSHGLGLGWDTPDSRRADLFVCVFAQLNLTSSQHFFVQLRAEIQTTHLIMTPLLQLGCLDPSKSIPSFLEGSLGGASHGAVGAARPPAASPGFLRGDVSRS